MCKFLLYIFILSWFNHLFDQSFQKNSTWLILTKNGCLINETFIIREVWFHYFQRLLEKSEQSFKTLIVYPAIVISNILYIFLDSHTNS